MKKVIILLAIVTLSYAAIAQPPAGFTGNRPGGTAFSNAGHIYGKVVDAAGKPIGGASVIILQNRFDTVAKKMKEILLKGTATENNGEFSVEGLPVRGNLKLKISATGYAFYETPVSFLPKRAPLDSTKKPSAQLPQIPTGGIPSFDKDLGKIKLETDVTQLQNISVVANKPLIKFDGEKKIFNVEKNIVSAGGTALDVMKSVPSVNVDIDGNVSLRNSPPQVFVDGRPTTLSLDQIPADAIESVEVITNPSAKYDASGGGAGILNIVLKKNRKTGYNGNLRAGVDKRGAVNGGGDFNVRQGKLNVSASIMGNQNKGRTTGTTERLNLLDAPQTSIFQNNYNRTNGGFLFGKLGVDYFVTNRTTLSLAGIRVHGQFEPVETININTDSLYNNRKISTFSDRTSTGKRIFNAYGLVAGMKHIFPKEGEELTVDANLFSGKNENNSLYTTNLYNPNGGIFTGTELQKVLGDGKNKFLTLQSDYVNPLNAKTKVEAGVRVSVRSIKSNNNNYIFDSTVNSYKLITNATSNYINHDNVYAGYVTYSSSIKDFTYKAGLRAESSNYSGALTNLGQKFSNKYPVSLFPSLFLTQKLDHNQQIQLSYSRRINRPNFFQIIPFIDYGDKLNITRGNPDLVPEFTQSFELSYLKTFKGNNTFLASAYYKATNNLITRFLDKQADAVTGEDILINTYINANSSYTAGAEFTAQNYLTKWWDISTNLNFYQSKINTDNITGSSQDALVSWFGKFNSNFKLPSKFSMQVTAIYQSKTNLPANSGGGGFGGGPGGGGGFGQSQSSSQGYIRSFWGTDIAVKKTFLKNDAAAVTLSVNDIFKTRKTNQYSESPFFIQNYERIRDPQMVRLNFTYKFGKIDMALFKRKVNSNTSDATEGMQQ
ncbi:MAG: TonB-dependent receptor [Ginsengibacter sp.]